MLSMDKTFFSANNGTSWTKFKWKRGQYTLLYITENAATRNVESLLGDEMSLKLVQNSAGNITYQKENCFRISMEAFKSLQSTEKEFCDLGMIFWPNGSSLNFAGGHLFCWSGAASHMLKYDQVPDASPVESLQIKRQMLRFSLLSQWGSH